MLRINDIMILKKQKKFHLISLKMMYTVVVGPYTQEYNTWLLRYDHCGSVSADIAVWEQTFIYVKSN